MSDEIKELKDAEKELVIEADASGESKPATRGNQAWIPGLILIGIGAIFLVNNFTDFQIHNWWALFILIPAFGSLGNAYRVYQTEHRLTSDARGSLIFGGIMFLVAAAFLFGWNWGLIWPAFLIIGGLGFLLSALLD